MKTYEELLKINPTKPICLISHIDPDADALSSIVVFREFLINHFKVKEVDVFAETEKLAEHYLEILEQVKLNPTPKNYDTAIILDSPNAERTGIYKQLFDCAKNKIVIDHHATNEYFGGINFVEMCSSTCEIIYSILKDFNYEINRKNQGKLYAGIITDTNNFTVGNITKRTHLIVSEIIENIKSNDIYNTFLQNTTAKQMKMLSLAINNLKYFQDNKILISHITKEEAEQYNTTFEDFANIIKELSTIEKSILVCFIYPKHNNYYVSLRAKPSFDVSSIAVKFQGGGHKGAAAYLSNKTIYEIEQEILNELTNELKSKNVETKRIF